MTVQELYDKFNTLITDNRWWSRFANSQFIRMMAMFGAQVIYVCRSYAETALPEGFISTANKRSSILAAAEDRGYVARMVKAGYGTVDINNKTSSPIQLPSNMTLWGENQYPYVLTDAVTIPANGVIQNAAVEQKELVTIDTNIDKSVEFLSILLPKDITAKTVDITVYVISDGVSEKWEHNAQFRLATGKSKNYTTFYKPTEQIGIRFGDGSIGMMPPDNCTIRLQVWTSEGDLTLVAGQRLKPSGDFQYLTTSVEIMTSTPVTNGADIESTEETRNRAMYSVVYDDQIVWRGDYKFYLMGKLPGISWLNVWGESDEETANGKNAMLNGAPADGIYTPPGGLPLKMVNGKLMDVQNINTIFFSAHKPGVTDQEIGDLIITALTSIPTRMNKKFKHYLPNKLPFTLTLTGKVNPEVIISDALTNIRQALESQFGIDSTTVADQRVRGFNTIKENDIWAAIQALSCLSEFKIEVIGMSEAVLPYDFIYLNVQNSTISISY